VRFGFILRAGTKEEARSVRDAPMTAAGAPGKHNRAAGRRHKSRIFRNWPPPGSPDPTVVGYIVALVGAYHNVRRHAAKSRRAASRFKELGRPEVAAYLEERAREETGHDRLALKTYGRWVYPPSDSSPTSFRRASSALQALR